MSAPMNLDLLDIDAYIRTQRLGEVKSLQIHAPSSTTFHPEGLFSEEIFGPLATEDRLVRPGYISLGTEVLHPFLYPHLLKVSDLHGPVLAGTAHARYDAKEKILVRAEPEDKDAGTGYSFFLAHLPKITFRETSSIQRQNQVELLKRYRDLRLKRFLVIPAGLREIDEEDGPMIIQDDINGLYRSLLSLTSSLPPGAVSDLFDVIRYRIQEKLAEISSHIQGILSGKPGLLQGGGYGSRNVALGTRNVITSATYEMASPDDPQALQPNETKAGIYQTAKGLQPIVSYYLRTAFLDPLLQDQEAQTVALTTKDYRLRYTEIDPVETERYTTADGIERIINRFRNEDVRRVPITIQDTKKKDHFLFLVHDAGHRITYVRSLQDAKEALGPEITKEDLRPVTWAELLYIATWLASKDRYCVVTRYPVLDDGSSYPSKIRLGSTLPSRVVTLMNTITGDEVTDIPEYPILGEDVPFLDSAVVHTSSLPGLGADHDGDSISVNYLMSDEANAECEAYFKERRSFITPEQRLVLGAPSDLVKLTLINLSLNP